MATLKQSTVFTRMFLMIQTSDHITGLTGAAPTVNISKAGAAFSGAAGTVTEVANGFYKIALTTADTGTLGDLAYHITAASGDPTDFVDQVTGNILGDTLPANTTQLAGQTVTAGAGVTFPTSVASPTNITAGTITTVTTVTNQLTAAQIATGIWQDTTAGDFTTASSIGKSLFTGVAPGVANGLFIAGTNAATTVTTALTTTFTGNLTGSVASVTGAVGSVSGLTASNLDTTISSRMATYTQPTGFLAATFPTGTVANTTNITAGTITTTTNLTNAPTAGDFTATMKTSLNAATPASVTGAVGSVTGNVGGNVTGSVSSVLTGGLIDLTSTTYGEPAGPVAATATLKDMLVWLKILSRNKITQTSTTETLFKDDGTTTVSTSTDSDDGTTFTRGKWS